jgi:3-oxosteroid 1-dehydrogenase
VSDNQAVDVVIVGAGAGGMLTAILAHDLGLRCLVIEQSDRYGGTSAVSGGAIWIPNNKDIRDEDSADAALLYLRGCTEDKVSEAKLSRYVEASPFVPAYLKSLGVEYYSHPVMSYPDYYPQLPGAMARGRTMFVKPMDGAVLGEEFFRLRESYPEFKLLGKITLDLPEGGQIAGKYPGWRRALARLLFNYWSDFSWRRRTYRDRRLAIGNALIGGLRNAMLERGIALSLKTRLTRIVHEDGRVSGIVANQEGREIRISAGSAVVIASGGFEQSQELRTRYLDQPTEYRWSATPRENNRGDALLAALDIGADVEFLNEAWWAPVVTLPSREAPNTTRSVPLFFERGYPHSLAVNRLGKRFVNEICSYHQFGQAMLRDNAATGANLPCWFIFDATFREKYPLGGLLPGKIVPDRKLPADWFDNLLYRAETLESLAEAIGLPRQSFLDSVARFNADAETGVDTEFGRGGNVYNQFFGDPAHGPNKVLGPVVRAPFYAVRLDLGDIGTKGGPKTDENANVVDRNGAPIPGLYAIGNAAGSVMGGAYPGAGATLGAAMTFGYVAAGHIALANSK